MLVSEAGHGRTAGRVEDAPATFGDQPSALAANGQRRRFAQASV
jgi:hypothetical protein